MNKRFLLINLKNPISHYAAKLDELGYLTGKPGGFLPNVLGTIAALTPRSIDIIVVDESIQTIDYNEPYDIVGISVCDIHLAQAREIVENFKKSKNNAIIVFGGPSVTIAPEIWRPLADVLIIGEAERIWPQFINEFIAGNYKNEYIEPELIDFAETPVPRYDWISKKTLKQYVGGCIQISRGCPYGCEFCTIAAYSGKTIRYKPIENIIKEFEQLHKMGLYSVFITDDNFSADKKKATEILKAIKAWNKDKGMSIINSYTINVADDEEFIKLTAESGTTSVYLGIESPNEESLKAAKKSHNTKLNMLDAVKNFHAYGIEIISAIIVGFDYDDVSIYQKQFDFYMQAGICFMQMQPLAAPDNTVLIERMGKENRLISWEDAGMENMDGFRTMPLSGKLVIPRLMSLEQFRHGFVWLYINLFNPENYVKRFQIFLENYENSKKSFTPVSPKLAFSFEAIIILIRIFRYALKNSNPKEKKLIWKMLKLALKSSNKQAFIIFMRNLLLMVNAMGQIKKDFPDWEQIGYPQ